MKQVLNLFLLILAILTVGSFITFAEWREGTINCPRPPDVMRVTNHYIELVGDHSVLIIESPQGGHSRSILYFPMTQEQADKWQSIKDGQIYHLNLYRMPWYLNGRGRTVVLSVEAI